MTEAHPPHARDFPAADVADDNEKRPATEAMCRGVFYSVLSLALHPPTLATFERLTAENARLALLEATPVVKSAAGSQDPQLSSHVEYWLNHFESLTLEHLLSRYGAIFGHTARGRVCPYETEYSQDGLFQQPQQLARITAFYAAFGLKPRQEERERADHISCELEFLEFLSLKEGYMIWTGDQTTLQETRKAIQIFLKEHPGRFTPALARELKRSDPEGFFGALSHVLLDFVLLESRRLGIEPGPALLRLRSTQGDNVPMACGADSDQLIQLEI